MTYQAFVKQRTGQAAKAFEAIEQARKIIAQLELLTVQTAAGQHPDLAEVAHATHALRGATDQILVSLVEARVVPETREQKQ